MLAHLLTAARSFRRRRAAAVAIVATLMLGIGANSAIFSIVRAMLLSPLPFRDILAHYAMTGDAGPTAAPAIGANCSLTNAGSVAVT